jgi:hypothetical protein
MKGTAESYRPRQFSIADYRRIKTALRERTPRLSLERGQTDTGELFVSGVEAPRWPRVRTAGDSTLIVIRGENCWLVHHPPPN